MRNDPWSTFGNYNFSNSRSPQVVAVIEYDDRPDIALSSTVGLKNIPSIPYLPAVITGLSQTSQRVIPIRGRAEIGQITLKALDALEYNANTYNFAASDYARAGADVKVKLPGKFEALFFPINFTANGAVGSIGNGFLRFHIAITTGELQIYKPSGDGGSPSPASTDNTGQNCEVFKWNRLIVWWDGDGNYKGQLNDGAEFSGTYNVDSTESRTRLGGTGSRSINGVVREVRLWEQGKLKRYWPMNEGSGLEMEERVLADDLTILGNSPLSGSWTADTGLSNALNFHIGQRLNPIGSPLSKGEDIRGKRVKIYVGFTDNFNDFEQVATAFVSSLSIKNNEYKFILGDITRELRRQVFDKKTTRLNTSIGSGSLTTVSVEDTSEFEAVQHTNAFTDAPGDLRGYIRMEETGEVMRWSSKSASPGQFTIEARALFGTTATAITVSGSDPEDWPIVEEYIYLELPAPALAWAVMTGEIWDTGSPIKTLPSHWHAGISPTDLDLEGFQNVGEDLYTSETIGLILRFTNLERVDAKKWIEEQIYVVAGTYGKILGDGRISLRRVNDLIGQSGAQVYLTEYAIARVGDLKHSAKDVVNQIQVDWAYDGEKYVQRTLYVDSDSIARNGASPVQKFKLQGLSSSFGVQRIQQLILRYQNRYRNPPMEITVDCVPWANVIEANDIAQITLADVYDLYAGIAGETLSRPFEVERISTDWLNGRVRLNCVASSGDGFDTDPAVQFGDNAQLADDFYTSRGTEMGAAGLTIVGGVVTAGGTLTGWEGSAPDLEHDSTHDDSIYYYDGDLTIDNLVTVDITHSVQLRIKGQLTINGTISGVGNGWDGLSPDYAVSDTISIATSEQVSQEGYVGGVSASDGLVVVSLTGIIILAGLSNAQGDRTEGKNEAFPTIPISGGSQSGSPIDTDVIGVPKSLTGARAGHGAPLILQGSSSSLEEGTGTVKALGGDGGNSGAGLVIICRGLAFGASGSIDLSGEDGSAGSLSTDFRAFGADFYAGSGAGGGQGSLFVVMDGGDLPSPESDLSTKFTAEVGGLDILGISATAIDGIFGQPFLFWDDFVPDDSPLDTLTGLNQGLAEGDPVFLQDGTDRSADSFRVSYVPTTD
jgi:hypothetical protein